jgi:acetyl/propionyl-CoA carboxylase alpha subunit
LLKEFKLTDFPDRVNQPTLHRLNEFLKGVGRPETKAVTVRGLVDRMMKMNIPDGCQCWKVFDRECMANVSHLSDEQRRTKRVLELQRVVVSCSRPIFNTIQEAYQEWGDAPAADDMVQVEMTGTVVEVEVTSAVQVEATGTVQVEATGAIQVEAGNTVLLRQSFDWHA